MFSCKLFILIDQSSYWYHLCTDRAISPKEQDNSAACNEVKFHS